MTDEMVRELVTRHDTLIATLVQSVEHLIKAQTEANKRLETVSEQLSKQNLIASQVEHMDKELIESFGRINERINEVKQVQTGEAGCNSVKLLHKDVDSVSKDVQRLIKVIEAQHTIQEEHAAMLYSFLSPNTIRFILGIVITYTVLFGIYVSNTLNELAEYRTSSSIKIDASSDDIELLKEVLVKGK